LSNDSSLYQSTPRREARHDGTTAFRRGEGYDANDPTAYRNAVQMSALRDASMVASAYNSTTLQSAWLEEEASKEK
jgi:hypothetical protein